MKIKAIAPWFGSKRNLAPTIVDTLGPHNCYWEPFCGSLAVLLAKPAASTETVNDLNGDLINLARTLADQDCCLELYSALSRFIMHEDLFHEAAARWKVSGRQSADDGPQVQRAIDFMVCSWFGRNGVAGTGSYNQGFCPRYTKNGGSPATRWRSVTDSIPAWHERLRGVTIMNRDGLALLERIDDQRGGVIYCDPPYLKKGARYIHDFEASDHVRMAELLRRFKSTRVVVSYYDDPQLAELYPDWSRIEISVSKAMASQGARDKANNVRALEVLLVNQPDGLFA